MNNLNECAVKSGTGEFANRSAATGAAASVTDSSRSTPSGMEQSAGSGNEPTATPRPSGLLISTDGSLPAVSSSMAQPTPTAPISATASVAGATANSNDATCSKYGYFYVGDEIVTLTNFYITVNFCTNQWLDKVVILMVMFIN